MAEPSAELVALAATLKPSRRWRTLAACRGMDPDLFHPHPGQDRQARRAKAVCARCDVQAECLADAMSQPLASTSGIWGGLSDQERRRLRRRPRRAAEARTA